MTSTAVRSTPNLTVPTTQNTAPVLEFRCLYTHDLRRKSKRWQDGFLCFHTFNKRVMVYDVPRNYIGDMHWRSGGTVQDGDELELEKGVLVQVGEGVGSIEQDLTELLEKRRVANESPRATKATGLPSPCPSSGNITIAPLTQLRPKSLNAVLGTPRGRYGRAILPTLSPFEERRQLNKPSFPEGGRSVKRQKLNSHPSNTIPQQSPSLPRARPSLTESRPIPIATTKITKPAIGRQEHHKPDFIEVDSADETPSEPKDNSIRASHIPSSKRTFAKKDCPASPLFCSSSSPVSTSNHLPPANPMSNHPQPPTEPSAAKLPAESDNTVPVNPLRPAARKPRKKLMYKDLLPPPKRPPSLNSSRDAVPQAPTNAPAPPAPPDELSAFHQAQRRRLDARMRRQRQLPDSRTSDSDETLRFPNEADTRLDTSALPPPPPALGLLAPTAGDSTKQPTIPLPRNAPTKPPHPLPPPPSRPTAPLRRSDSAPGTSTLRPPPAPHDSSAPAARPPAVLAGKAKGPFKKWASLPIPLPARPTGAAQGTGGENGIGVVGGAVGSGGGNGRGKAKAEAEEDTGPWSREAADLFAWRPPCGASTLEAAPACASAASASASAFAETG